MKRILLLIFLLNILTIPTLIAQDFDTELEKLAQDIALKIDKKGKTRIAVWGFVTENGESTSLGNYITEDFSVYVTNFGENFEVIDRNHLNTLLKEHKLNSEGYIDENTAKELGKIAAVDAIITGTYTVLNSKVKVRAKVLDTETALQFVASMANLPLNEDVASYLGISVNGGNTTNKGFNTPLNSNETVNDPKTVDSKCADENFGDLCFFNNSKNKVIIRIAHDKYSNGNKGGFTIYKEISLDSGETKCVYTLPNAVATFYIANWNTFLTDFKGREGYISNRSYAKFLKDKGEIMIETCKSKTYTIK